MKEFLKDNESEEDFNKRSIEDFEIFNIVDSENILNRVMKDTAFDQEMEQSPLNDGYDGYYSTEEKYENIENGNKKKIIKRKKVQIVMIVLIQGIIQELIRN